MLTHALFALALAASDSSTAPAVGDTAASPRVVRRLEEVLVRASPLHDLLSSESVQIMSRQELRSLPIDHVTDAIALKAGIVAQGEELHVRGGRAGETQLVLRGLPLADARRGLPMELPLLALESIELVSGGLDAEHGGALAGVIEARTVDPGTRWAGEARGESDGGFGGRYATPTSYRRYAARVGGPVALGLGAVLAADALTDDTYLPALRTRIDRSSWHADNRLVGFAKLAPVAWPGGPTLEIFGSRVVQRPYDPIWSLDGYTTPCADPFCTSPGFSAVPLPGYSRYRAADHAVMTDEERVAAVLSAARALALGRARVAAGVTATRRLTSVGGRDDESYLDIRRAPVFGVPGSPISDPIFAYAGDDPFFQQAMSSTWMARADWDRTTDAGNRLGFGAGLSYDQVTLRELDLSTRGTGLDSLRSYDAWAPGGFAYGQGRWIYQGMVLNGGLRLGAFTAGPQAERQTFGAPAHLFWTLEPRLGIAYPTSTRDVLSFSYVRLNQPPPRDFLYENRTFISGRQPLGNPALEPSTVVSYQVALKHLYDQRRALQLAFFFRDLFGQIGARRFEVRPNVFEWRYENADEGHAEGFEVGAFLPTASGRVEVQYTFMHADGTSSLPEGFPFGTSSDRIAPIGDHPLDWDRRHSFALLGSWERPVGPPGPPPHGPIEALFHLLRGAWSLNWATRVGSPLPWTPSVRNTEATDPALINAARLEWEENTSVALRWSPALSASHLWVGLDVRNLFDFRGERAATLSGYPLPEINTIYDDDGAFRGETGLPGGAYWDNTDRRLSGDWWVRIHDPRLFNPPRLVRLSVNVPW